MAQGFGCSSHTSTLAAGSPGGASPVAGDDCDQGLLEAGRFLEAEKVTAAALRELDDELEVARCLRRLAEAQLMIGRFAAAEASLERSIPVLEQRRGMEGAELAPALEILGRVYLRLGAPDRAREPFEASLRIRRRSPERADAARSLDGLGDSLSDLGRYEEAYELYESAYELRITRDTPDRAGVAASLTKLGSLHLAQGRVSLAEQELLDALQGWQEAGMGSHPSAVPTVGSLASLYASLGDYGRARSLLEASLAIQRRSLGLSSPMSFLTMDNLASVYREQGDLVRAGAIDDLLLETYEAFSDDQLAWLFAGTAGGLPEPWLASRKDALRRVSHAVEVLEERLGPSHPSVGWGALYLAYLDDLAGKDDRAAEWFARALEVAEADALPALKANTFYLYAVFLYERGDAEAAIFFGKRAVDAWRDVVVSVASMPPTKHDAFERNSRALFENVTSWLIEAGRLQEAQEIIGVLKVFELRTFTNGGGVRSGDDEAASEGLPATLSERESGKRYQRATEHVASLSREYEDFRWKSRHTLEERGGSGEKDPARVAELRTALAKARREFRQALEDLTRELRESGRGEALESRALAGRSLQSSLRHLGHGAVAIHYLALEDHLQILVTAPATQLAKKVAVSRAELRGAVFAMLEAVRTRTRDPRASAGRLYDLVLAPIRPELDAIGAETLMISADDALRYVPWSALYDRGSEAYLVQRFAFALYAEVARNQLERPREDHPMAAGFGVSKAMGGFAQLPEVVSELETIVRRDRDDDGVYDGEIYLDAEFNSDSFVSALESGFQLVHIASHFEFRPGNERESFLLLGDGTRLSLGAIRERDLPFDEVDLVTLSACDTAVGATSDGREIEGLAGVVQGQGAASVVATLWQVYDPSTAILMRRFYESLARRRTKARALQLAELYLLAPELTGGGPDAGGAPSIYRHPYYWAPFLLIGNWR